MKTTTSERRAHARIAVPMSVQVIDGKREQELSVRDVSKSGIFLFSKKPPGEVGTLITLRLSLVAGLKPVEVKAEIVRVVLDADHGDEVLGFGAHFVEMTPERESALINFLDRAMLGRGSLRRIYPRVYHYVEVRCRTRTELKALVRDIGEGGAGLTVDREMQLDEEISIEISQGALPSLRLRGNVVSCVRGEGPAPSFRIGLRFSHLTMDERAELQAYMKGLYRK